MLTKERVDEFNEIVSDLKRDLSGTFAGDDGYIYWYGDALQDMFGLLGFALNGYMKNMEKNDVDD